MIREAQRRDVAALLEIAQKQSEAYPKRLKWDHMKARALLITLISNRRHFTWVSENDNGVSGGLITHVSPGLWYERSYAAMLLWVAAVPGDGAKLLREFKTWALAFPAVRVAGFCPDLNSVDSRAWLLAERIGFSRQGGSLVLYC